MLGHQLKCYSLVFHSYLEATDLQLERKVAVKLISENLIADPAALDRFQLEARMLAGF
jgi:hypothetical protein